MPASHEPPRPDLQTLAGAVAGSTDNPSGDLTARYTARLDTHLAGLADDTERRAFLLTEHIKWIARYERFCARVDGGDAPHFGETAFDYALTIAEIGARRNRLERAAAGAA